MSNDTHWLESIASPHQLRRMSVKELEQLAAEVRARIIDVVRRKGGHLASNLGITELTVALHYVYDFSRDRLLWDVGHQCYPHKMMTGRAKQFDTLREGGGISGFPSPAESDYDLFYTGHAGTAVSTATGLAQADLASGRETNVVAVVGDASIANGLSVEGLNNAALLNRQFLLVLNDNNMAIDRPRGALAEALEHMRMTDRYRELKHSTEHLLKHLPLGEGMAGALKYIKEGVRTTLHGGQMFEALGFNYFGPIDGHDIGELIRVLQRIGHLDTPTVLHIHTEKGRGCPYAVDDPTLFHSPAAHTIQNGKAVFDKPKAASWTKVFAGALRERARQDERVVALTAAMPDGTGLADVREEFPDRTIDVGIAESHAVAAAAGMAKAGLKPVVAIYSTFMQRAFDQIFHECALQRLPVVFAMDRAGLVGSDGAVHHGFADIALLRTLPGMILAAPADVEEMSAVLEFALGQDGPVAIRYARDVAPEGTGDCPAFQIGRSRTLRDGKAATILAYGSTVAPALDAATTLAADGTEVAVVNARFAKPLDKEMLADRIAAGPLLVVEDHARIGGLGSAVLELAAENDWDTRAVRLLGIPDRFVAHASRPHQLRVVGLDAEGIATAARGLIQQHADMH
ncbi:MAG: 1-deoxy-D-xylulose-5-phosphate synthase [Planctomycetes bacterium]|jgi:1-deoxy-D-xylulose-5-phosphate synthase|nr:1-deoxy-D-xylulose-5-phosphate synthase [Phycisphaerae bacterium]NBB96253.1 1-deoxy-D-xylulose-5-phosphate synthase [Planctomycetota bacterium]